MFMVVHKCSQKQCYRRYSYKTYIDLFCCVILSWTLTQLIYIAALTTAIVVGGDDDDVVDAVFSPGYSLSNTLTLR